MKNHTRRSEAVRGNENAGDKETIMDIGKADKILVCAQDEFCPRSRRCDHAAANLENKMKAYTEATAIHMSVALAQAQMSQTQVAEKP